MLQSYCKTSEDTISMATKDTPFTSMSWNMGSVSVLTLYRVSPDFNPDDICTISTTYMELLQNQTCAGLMETVGEKKSLGLLLKILFYIQMIMQWYVSISRLPNAPGFNFMSFRSYNSINRSNVHLCPFLYIQLSASEAEEDKREWEQGKSVGFPFKPCTQSALFVFHSSTGLSATCIWYYSLLPFFYLNCIFQNLE